MMLALTRRTALAGILSAPLVSAVQAEADHHPDAALLLLGEELETRWALLNLVAAKSMITRDKADDAAFDEAFAATSAIVDMIEQHPVRTLDGLRVKARAVLWCQGDEIVDLIQDQDTTDVRIASSIVNALLGVAS